MTTVRSPLVLVAALAKNRVIGKDGTLPWSLPEDLRHFRAVTTGHAIVMGRKTHLSIGKPLPNRRNIVITRDRDAAFAGCETAPDLATAIALARQTDDAPRIVGGGQIYAEALPFATDLMLTELDREVPGDVHFPAFDAQAWDVVEARDGETEGVRFVHYRRRADP